MRSRCGSPARPLTWPVWPRSTAKRSVCLSLGSFEDHDGHDGVIFGLPDASRQLEIVRTEETIASPSAEDQLVFYLGSSERVEEVAAQLREAGHEPQVSPNPYWERTGAVCFVDPDGYWLVISPEAW